MNSHHGRSRRLFPGFLCLALALGSLLVLPLSAGAASVGLREVGTGLTTVTAVAGESLEFELFLNTDGLDLQGYALGIDLTGGSVSGLSVAHESLSSMFELFGPPVIDNGAGTIRNINQASLSGGLPSGVYVLDIIGVTMGSTGDVLLTPGLFGETLGLGGGSCPGTTVGCAVSFETASIVPEPGTGMLLMTGLISAALFRRRRSASPRLLAQNANA